MPTEQGEPNLSLSVSMVPPVGLGLLGVPPHTHSDSVTSEWTGEGFPYHREVARERDACLRPGVVRPIWCCNSICLGQVELEGLTGHIEFNSKGQRSNYALKILQFTRNGFRQVSLPMLPR